MEAKTKPLKSSLKQNQGHQNVKVNLVKPTNPKIQDVLTALKLVKEKFTPATWKKIKQLIELNLAIFPADEGNPGISKLPAMDFKTTGEPVRCRPYKTTPKDREFLRDTINRLLDSGLLTPSNSPWGFPVLVVANAKGKLRMCVNYKKLNAQTRMDAYPLPKIEEILNTLGGNCYYSTLDLCQGFHQVKLSEKPDKDGFTAKDKSSMAEHGK